MNRTIFLWKWTPRPATLEQLQRVWNRDTREPWRCLRCALSPARIFFCVNPFTFRLLFTAVKPSFIVRPTKNVFISTIGVKGQTKNFHSQQWIARPPRVSKCKFRWFPRVTALLNCLTDFCSNHVISWARVKSCRNKFLNRSFSKMFFLAFAYYFEKHAHIYLGCEAME